MKYGTNDNGWISTELFESWFFELFLPNAVAARPLLLLLDGHSTHYQLDVIKLAKENDVNILCLPPHTSHATQPLDCGVFSPLKAQWSVICHEYFQKNPGKVITKFNFNQLFSQAWLKSLTPANMISGFKTCGIYPYNRKAVRAVPNQDSAKVAGNEVVAASIQALNNIHALEEGIEVLSAEQELLFIRRFEEGYDLHTDPAYNRWLKKNHPEVDSDFVEPQSLDNTYKEVPALKEGIEILSPEQEQLFIRRFEEGYDLYTDPAYNQWLERNHPEVISDFGTSSLLENFLCIEPLSPLRIEDASETAAVSLADSNTDVPSSAPTPPSGPFASTSLATQSVTSASTQPSASTPPSATQSVTSASTQPSATQPSASTPPSATQLVTSASTQPSASTPPSATRSVMSASTPPLATQSVTSAQIPTRASPLSALLVEHTPKISHAAGPKHPIPKARLLTSSDCLAMLEEKEMKKKKALAEKEQRQKEREQKKKLKEEEAKRKAQEKAKKAEEKARKEVERAQEKARKEEEKLRRSAESAGRRKRKATLSTEAANTDRATHTASDTATGSSSDTATGSSSDTVTRTSSNTATPATGTSQQMSGAGIDTDVCCMCFGNYEDDVLDGYGAEWIRCTCGRWLHLDCAEDCIKDQHGKERYCPYCIDGLY